MHRQAPLVLNNICPPARQGLTLFEVLLSLAIFAGAMAAIGQLVSNGVRGAVKTRLETQAVLRAETIMAEVVSGVLPFQSTQNTPFSDDPAWHSSVSIHAGPTSNLSIVEVTAAHPGTSKMADVSFTLRRYQRDPALYLQIIATPPQNSSTTSSTSGTATTGGS